MANQIPQQNPTAKKVFGPALKELRDARGWSQNDLAFECRPDGPGYHAITKYESTGALPVLRFTLSLADVFELEKGRRARFLLLAGHDPIEGQVVIDGEVVYDFAVMAAAAAAPVLDITCIMNHSLLGR